MAAASEARRLVVTEEGKLIVRGEHDGGPLVSVLGPGGHIEPWPLRDLVEEVALDGNGHTLVVRGGPQVGQVPEARENGTQAQQQGRNGRVGREAMRLQLERSRRAGWEEGQAQGLEAGREEGLRVGREAADVQVPAGARLVGQGQVPGDIAEAGDLVMQAAGGGCAGVVLGAVIAGTYICTSIPVEPLLIVSGALIAGHLVVGLVTAWRTGSKCLKFWSPVRGEGGQVEYRVGRGGDCEVRAWKGLEEDWRPLEEFCAVDTTPRPKKTRRKSRLPG